MDWWPRGAFERRTAVLSVRPADDLVAVRVFNGLGEAQTVTGAWGRSARLVVTGDAFAWPGQRYSGAGIDCAAEFVEEPNEVAEGLRLAVKRLEAHADHARNAESPSGPCRRMLRG